MKARIVKGGWFWLGIQRATGEVIDAPSAEWIANREGLVEAIDEPPTRPPVIESAMLAPSETAVIPAARKRKAKEL